MKPVFRIIYSLILLILATLHIGCSGVKPAAQAYTATQPTLSATTLMLLQDIEQDMQAQHSTWNTYIPSANIIDLYGLKKTDNTFYVRGNVITYKGTDLSSVIGNKGNIHSVHDTLYTVNISIHIIPDLLKCNAIQYIDISIPARPNTSTPLPDNAAIKVN